MDRIHVLLTGPNSHDWKRPSAFIDELMLVVNQHAPGDALPMDGPETKCAPRLRTADGRGQIADMIGIPGT